MEISDESVPFEFEGPFHIFENRDLHLLFELLMGFSVNNEILMEKVNFITKSLRNFIKVNNLHKKHEE